MREMPLISNLLFVNTPQLIRSFVYLSYNNIFTCMVLAHEYGRFASVRKPLRVSQPCGLQRTSLWPQLPYRYIVPMFVAVSFLHWSVARSLYLVHIAIYWLDGFTLSNIHGSEFSPYAIILALPIGGVLILALVAPSLRTLDPGMPLVGPCTLAISAACHPGKDEADTATRPVQYGVITGEEADELGRRRVGFSSRAVEPLVKDEAYV
jgi:hypothetical protein